MPYGTAPRSAHRAAPAIGPLGDPRRAPQVLTTALGALILSAICALGGFFFVVADERRGREVTAVPPAGPAVRTENIRSRTVDGRPLSLDEVFPSTRIRLVAGAAPYTVDMTHIDTDCRMATVGRLGGVLDDHACSQVVRARITAPYGGYRVTAGVFNLADESGAAVVDERVREMVVGADGSFAAMGAGLSDVDQPLAQVGWNTAGHYLVYCVITRPDGRMIAADDPYAPRITADLVEGYLGDTVLGRRARHGDGVP